MIIIMHTKIMGRFKKKKKKKKKKKSEQSLQDCLPAVGICVHDEVE